MHISIDVLALISTFITGDMCTCYCVQKQNNVNNDILQNIL